MNFQDIVDNSNKQLEELKSMASFIDQVKVASKQGDTVDNLMFTNCYKGNVNSINTLLRSMYMNVFREKLIEIDGYELAETINKIKNTYENGVINTYLEKIKQSYKQIIEIRKMKTDNEIINNFVKCKKLLNDIVTNYEYLKILITYMNLVNKDLSRGIEEAPLRIRTFNEEITADSINCLIVPIRQIYNELGYIFKVNTSEEPLDVVRIESGSLESLFNGNTVLCTMVGFLLPKLYEQFTKRHTNNGIKLSLSESMDLLLKENEISKKFKENGIDTKEIDEGIKKKMILISKQSDILFLAHPDLKINKRVIKRSEEMERLLGKSVYKIEAKVDIVDIEEENIR